MAVIYPPDHPYSLELAKWNKPYRYEEYPRCLYMAQRRPDGKYSTGESLDSIFGGAAGSAEAFTRSCQTTVRSDDEKQRRMEEGWRLTQADAMERHAEKEKALSTAAAERLHAEQRMSDKAKAEAAAADAAAFEHLPEIPQTPKRKYVKKQQPSA